jgi:hypothetical protein
MDPMHDNLGLDRRAGIADSVADSVARPRDDL